MSNADAAERAEEGVSHPVTDQPGITLATNYNEIRCSRIAALLVKPQSGTIDEVKLEIRELPGDDVPPPDDDHLSYAHILYFN